MGSDAGNLKGPERTVRQTLDVWVLPEIRRRQEAGNVPKPFPLWAAQILFEVGARAPIIRLNEEIRGVFEARPNRPIDLGSTASLDDFSQITGVWLHQDDHPDAGHITLVLHNERWNLFFDARYNGQRIQEELGVATQFLELARVAAEREYCSGFVDNLFSAVELLAKCVLLLLPDEHLLKSKRHPAIAQRLNRHGQLGNVPIEFTQLRNRLEKLREKGRYRERPFRITDEETKRLLATADEMRVYVDRVRPRRSDL